MAEFRFGLLEFRTYTIGDRLTWNAKGEHRRPPGGDLDGAGYVECPACGHDYWLAIKVRSDVIVKAKTDPDRPGYMLRDLTPVDESERAMPSKNEAS